MSENDIGEVILWPSKENYPRFVEVCDGSVQPAYDHFVAVAQPIFDRMRASGAQVTLVDPNPDEMAAWCRSNFGHVNSNARAAYAAVVALRKDADDTG